jgi:hypothetical protein
MRPVDSIRSLYRLTVSAALLLAPLGVSHAAPSTADDRIALSANGESLTGTNGGAGGSAGWLHNFNSDALVGIGVEHQALANAHWTFGSLNGSYTTGPADERYTVFGEVHEGGGNSGARSIDYRTETLGGAATFDRRLSLQLEAKYINIDTISGYLPKAAVSYLWGPHFQTQLAYSYSIGGNNLGTRLASARIDIYQPAISFLGGFSFGQATAAVLSYVGTTLETNVPGARLKEGYVGATVPLPRLRSEISVILDYQDLSSRLTSSKRFQGTVNYIFHVGHRRT